jgi:hypothetical protein
MQLTFPLGGIQWARTHALSRKTRAHAVYRPTAANLSNLIATAVSLGPFHAYNRPFLLQGLPDPRATSAICKVQNRVVAITVDAVDHNLSTRDGLDLGITQSEPVCATNGLPRATARRSIIVVVITPSVAKLDTGAARSNVQVEGLRQWSRRQDRHRAGDNRQGREKPHTHPFHASFLQSMYLKPNENGDH